MKSLDRFEKFLWRESFVNKILMELDFGCDFDEEILLKVSESVERFSSQAGTEHNTCLRFI